MTHRVNADELVLSRETIARLDRAIFEVVVPRERDEYVTTAYERPWHKLPFKFRNDKYFSTGTSFAIGPNRFASAAHVFSAERDSLPIEYSIRGTNGKIFKIARFYRYSNYRDVVEFSVESPPDELVILAPAPKPSIGDTVFNVGNALGEGISYRGGVIASFTPERIEGKWQMLRFSAPASPGNSGGPLLTSRGEALGVVVQRSNQAENLNVAVPLEELSNLSTSEAEFYQQDIAANVETKVRRAAWRFKTPLPATYDEIARASRGALESFMNGLYGSLFKEYGDELFPKNPALGGYFADQLTEFKVARIRGNASLSDWRAVDVNPGKVQVGMGQYLFAEQSEPHQLGSCLVDRPKGKKLAAFLKDPKAIMEAILRGRQFNFDVADESIAITSLGQPHGSLSYRDGLGRPWHSYWWDLRRYHERFFLECTPLPNGAGCVVGKNYLAYLTPAWRRWVLNYFQNELLFRYAGSLAAWKEFLALDKDWLPDAFRGGVVETKGGHLKLRVGRFSLDGELDLPEDAEVRLVPGYPPDHRLAMELVQLFIGADDDRGPWLGLGLKFPPVDYSSPEVRREWKLRWEHEPPYDGKVFVEGPYKKIRISRESPSGDALYVTSCVNDMNRSPEKLEKLCKAFQDAIRLDR